MMRIEYDGIQKLLRIYGPIEERWWTSQDMSTCQNKFGANPEDKDSTWIEIPAYFEKFKLLEKELSEKSGKNIEFIQRPFRTY